MKNQTPLSRLIIFTRYPEPGKTKTRLISALGPEGAADLQRQMTEQTLICARRLAAQDPVILEVCFESGGVSKFQKWLGNDLIFVPQGNGDLGERMSRAFQRAFQGGARFVVLIGTDIPGFSADLAWEAFAALQNRDVVLGPANDGGYYLIGLRKIIPQLFAAIPWGTENVFSKTLEIAMGLRLRVHCLAPLNDVDRPEDLPVWGNSSH